MTNSRGSTDFPPEIRCNAFHEERLVWCDLDPEHDGAHGWDYEAEEPAFRTLKQEKRRLIAGGLPHLAERLDWLVKDGIHGR